jgi:ABC-type uncharacterized transport system auxiliary subunit
VLGVSAELIDWTQRRLLARRTFQREATVSRSGAAGLAEAASQAIGTLLGELGEWTAARAAAAR